MPIALYILTGLMILVAALTVVKPAYVFEYPVAAATLMCAFLLPQAWAIERKGDLADFEPSTTWTYMILCMVMIILGYLAGRSTKQRGSVRNTVIEDFDTTRLTTWALVLWSIGGVAVILMLRQEATMQAHEAWTGVIAFYSMMANLFLYGTVICWVAFLRTRNKVQLIVAVIGLAVFSGQFFYSARREGSFVLGMTLVLGWYFAKRKMVGRLILLPLMLIGALLVNQAGLIRGHIETNNDTIIGALSSKEVVDAVEKTEATSEVSSAVSDIAIANESNQYRLATPFYNQLVNLYVPAFLLGRDFKDGMLIAASEEEDVTGSRYFAMGSTRTGFGDTFQSLHYFGCLIFFAIAYFMGVLWNRATRGDLTGQILYMLTLAGALKVLTESAGSFVGVLPLLFGSVGIALYMSRKPRAAPNAGRPDVAVSAFTISRDRAY